VAQTDPATGTKRKLDDEATADGEPAAKKLATTADLPGWNLYLCQQKLALFFIA